MEVPWPPFPDVFWELPCPPGGPGRAGALSLCMEPIWAVPGCALGMGMAALAALLQCTLARVRWLFRGCSDPRRSWDTRTRVAAEAGTAPVPQECCFGTRAGLCRGSLPSSPGHRGAQGWDLQQQPGKLLLPPRVPTRPDQQGTPLGLGKDTPMKTNPEVTFSPLPGCTAAWEEFWLGPEESPAQARHLMLAPGREWVSGSPQTVSEGDPAGLLHGGAPRRNSVWPEAGVPAVRTAECQGKGHNKVCSRTWWPWAQQVTPVHQTRGGPGCQTSPHPSIPPGQHSPCHCSMVCHPCVPTLPGKLPYLGGAELAHADHWFVPEAAAKLAKPLAGGDVALGEMSPCVTQHPVPGLVLLWVQAAPAGLGSSKGLRAVQARLRDVIICLIFLGADEPLPEFIN